MGKSSPSPPAYPNPATTAATQDKYNKEDALYQSALNNVNQITPYGNLTYSLGTRSGSGSGTGTGTGTGSGSGTGGGTGTGAGILSYAQWQAQYGNQNYGRPDIRQYDTYLNSMGVPQSDWAAYKAGTGASSAGGVSGSSAASAAGTSGAGSGSTANPSLNGLPQWTSTITLSPQEQAIFDEQMANQKQAGALAGDALGQYKTASASPIDYSKFTAIPGMGDMNASMQTAVQAQMDLLNPEMDRQQEMLRTRLANEGLSPGSDAWNNSWQQFNNLNAQTLDNATLNAQSYASQGLQNALSARNQQINEAQLARDVPLNEYQALMGGSQVTNPQFASPQNTQVGATNYANLVNNQYQGALNAYNAQTASNNSMMGGLFGLGGSFLGSPWAGGLFGF